MGPPGKEQAIGPPTARGATGLRARSSDCPGGMVASEACTCDFEWGRNSVRGYVKGPPIMGNASAASQSLPLGLPERRVALPSGWARFAAFLVIGYLCMGRSFAYLGLPWFSLYIGEMALAAFLLFGPRTKQGRWLRIAQRVRGLRRFEWSLLLLLCYGGFEALRGIANGYPAFTAARDTAFNYYPLYLFLGVWAGLRGEDFLRRLVRSLAWFSGCYGVAWILILHRLPWTVPGTPNKVRPVPLFSGPSFAASVALLGLLSFEPKPRRVWHLVLLNLFVLFGELVRAEWVGFGVGLFLFALLTKRLRVLFIVGSAATMLLAAMVLLNVSLPSPRSTGGVISPRYIVARAVSPLSKSMAENLAPQQSMGEAVETAEWRLVWWAGIWAKVNSNRRTALLGLGYGYPIGELNPFIAEGRFIQTPHNDFFYALGFSGWLGVALFGLFQVEIARLLWRGYRATGQPFGLTCWAALLTSAMFTEILEGPFGAIPFYLLVGAALAPGLLVHNPDRARALGFSAPPSLGTERPV